MTPEAAVLSSVLQDSSLWRRVESFNLSPLDFNNPTYRKMFSAMRELASEGAAIDLITLLDKDKSIDAVEASDVINGLADPAALSDYAEAMIGNSVRERAELLLSSLSDASGPEVLERMQRFIEKNNRFRRGDGIPWGEEIADVVDDILVGRFRDACLKTGYPHLDRLILGLRPGAVYIIAGRPGMGKTTLGFNILLSLAQRDIPVGAISLEMSRHELIVRLLSELSGVSTYTLSTGMIPKDQHGALQRAEMVLKNAPLHIVDNAPSTINGVIGSATEMVQDHGAKCILIDYLQLMRGDGRHGGREQEVANISRRLTELARQLDVPIVSLSQLSRKSEQRTDKRPELSDLRESGSLEQDATVAMFLHRPGYYLPADDDGAAELHVLKNRHGAQGVVRLEWDAKHSRFLAA